MQDYIQRIRAWWAKADKALVAFALYAFAAFVAALLPNGMAWAIHLLTMPVCAWLLMYKTREEVGALVEPVDKADAKRLADVDRLARVKNYDKRARIIKRMSEKG